MRDAVHTSQEPVELQVQEIAPDEVEALLPGDLGQVPLLAPPGVIAGEGVHPDHLVSYFEQPLHEGGPYEPRRSRHQYPAQ